MASDTSLTIKLGVDSSSASKQVSELTKELKNLDKQISSLDTSTGNYAKDMNNLGQKSELVQTKIGGLEEKLKAQNTQLENARTKLETAKKQYQELANSGDASAKSLSDAANKVEVAQKSFNNLSRQVGDTERALESAREEFDDINKQMEQMKWDKPIKELDNTIEALDKQIDTIDTTTSSFSKNLENMGTKATLTESKISALEDKLALQNTALTRASTELIQAREAYDRLKNSSEASAEEIQKAAERVSEAENKYNELNQSVLDTSVALSKAEQSLASLNGRIEAMNIEKIARGFEGLGEICHSIGDSFESISRATAPMSAALTGGFTAAVKTVVDYEEAIAKVAATSGATADEMELLSNKAREIGSSTQLSASQGAEALLLLAQAGYDTNSSIAMVDDTVNLSIASALELGEATSIVTSIIASFGLGVEDATHVTDVLSKTAASSNTNVSLLGEGFGDCAATMSALGYTVEDTATLIGILGNNAIEGSNAGTALKSIMASLAKPTENAAKIMKDWGISLADANGESRPLLEVLSDFRAKFAELDEVQKAEYASTLVGKYQLTGFLALMNTGQDDVDALASAIENCDGKTAEMRQTMEETTAGGFKELLSKLEEMGIQIGNILLPVINDFVDVLGSMIDWFNTLDAETQKSIIQWALMAAAISPITGILGKVLNGFGSLFDGISSGLKVISSVKEAMAGGAGLCEALAGQNGLLGAIGKVVTGFTGGGGLTGALGTAGSAISTFISLLAPLAGTVAIVWGLYEACKSIYEVTVWDNTGVMSATEFTEIYGESLDKAKQKMEALGQQSQATMETVVSNTKEMIRQNATLNSESYQESLTALQDHHKTMLTEIETNRSNQETVIRAQYANDLALARQQGSDKVAEVEKAMQAEIDANNEYWDTMQGIESQGYQQCQTDLEMSLDERYATDSYWQQQFLQNQQDYFDNASVILGTGLQAMEQEYESKYSNINARVLEYANSSKEIQTQLYDDLVQDLANSKQAEMEIINQRYENEKTKLQEAFGEITDQNRAEYEKAASELKAAKETELATVEQHYVDLQNTMNQGTEKANEIWTSAFNAQQEALQKGYDEELVSSEAFWIALEQYYRNGGTNIDEAITTAAESAEEGFNDISTSGEESAKSFNKSTDSMAKSAHDNAKQIDPAFDEIDKSAQDMADGVEDATGDAGDSMSDLGDDAGDMGSDVDSGTNKAKSAGNTMMTALVSALTTTGTNFIKTSGTVSTETRNMQSNIDSVKGKEVDIEANFKENGFNNLWTKISNLITSPKTFSFTSIFSSSGGKNSGVVAQNFGTNYSSDIYGMKDAGVKTISLSSFGDDSISAYATKDSMAGELVSTAVHNYNNSYSTVATNNNDNLGKKLDILIELITQQQAGVIIQNMQVDAQNKSTEQIMKEIDFITKFKGGKRY